MAILKHIASKNTDYGEAERYLIFQHDEYTQKPILDDNGNMLLREEYYLDGINCDPFTFDVECRETNAFFHKNLLMILSRITTSSALILKIRKNMV